MIIDLTGAVVVVATPTVVVLAAVVVDVGGQTKFKIYVFFSLHFTPTLSRILLVLLW